MKRVIVRVGVFGDHVVELPDEPGLDVAELVGFFADVAGVEDVDGPAEQHSAGQQPAGRAAVGERVLDTANTVLAGGLLTRGVLLPPAAAVAGLLLGWLAIITVVVVTLAQLVL